MFCKLTGNLATFSFSLRHTTQLIHSIRHYLIPRLSFYGISGNFFLTNGFSPKNRLTRTIYLSAVRLKVVPFKLSDIGEGIREVVVKEWFVKVGDSVHQFDPVCEVQSDKATVTITSRYDGTVRAVHFQPQEMCSVGQPLVDIELSMSEDDGDDDVSLTSTSTQHEASASDIQVSADDSRQLRAHNTESPRVLTTPSVRRLAMENKIKLSDVIGTGKDGRILKEDVVNFVNRLKVSAQKSAIYPPPSAMRDSLSDDTLVPLTNIQRSMKNSMMASNRIPHFVLSDELDLTKLVQLRNELSGILANERNLRLTYMPFFIKAASLALSRFPMLNAYTDETCDKMIYKVSHNIGVAMDTPDGLLVPNVKSVDKLSVTEIAEELKRLQDLGQYGKLGIADLSGGTMTLSNIGSIGGTYTAPRILPPQVLIGGLGRVQRLPRFDEHGNVRVGNILNVSWAADHRVIDGATVTKFCKLWKSYLESPSSMILHLK